jgi:triacylglycerol esterase/lipase EstA (alpha/beta hydrolase family)
MGGLGCRAYLTRHGGGRVARLVTLCSPHHGTALAPLGSGENARQMRIGSAFLMDLERRENGAAAVPTLCVYSCHDNLVAPYDSASLEWARNVAIAGRGHFEILGDEALFAAVEAEIRAAAGAAPA